MEVAAGTAVRGWLHCGSCGHLWPRSGVGLLVEMMHGAAWMQPGANGEVAAPAGPPEIPPPAHRTPPVCHPRATDRRSDADVEEWLCREMEELAPAGSRSGVDAWLTSDPFEALERSIRPDAPEWLPESVAMSGEIAELNELVGPTASVPAARAPKTLMERLDAFHQGLVRLEQFVARAAQLEEAAARPVEAGARPAVPSCPGKTAVPATILPFRAAS